MCAGVKCKFSGDSLGKFMWKCNIYVYTLCLCLRCTSWMDRVWLFAFSSVLCHGSFHYSETSPSITFTSFFSLACLLSRFVSFLALRSFNPIFIAVWSCVTKFQRRKNVTDRTKKSKPNLWIVRVPQKI